MYVKNTFKTLGWENKGQPAEEEHTPAPEEDIPT